MSRRLAFRTAVTAITAAAVAVLAGCGSGKTAASGSASTPGFSTMSDAKNTQHAVMAVPSTPRITAEGRTTAPPWDAPADPSARVAAAGLGMMGAEGNVMHIHAHLDVLVNGKPVTVPAFIGIDEKAKQISPVHTHDPSGIIHIESPAKATFTLGQFMTEWNVALDADRIGGLKAGGGNLLRAYVNGKQIKGDPAAIMLHAHEEIALVYGPANEKGKVPATFPFRAGM
ncbi:MAG: hypothetical protein JO362_08935 [Streptomycetaceae bacterium]|nr:hypothetical protein [Streptomycetaceae bacterium]